MKFNKKYNNLMFKMFKILKIVLILFILLFLLYVMNRYFLTNVKEGIGKNITNKLQNNISSTNRSIYYTQISKNEHDTRETFENNCDYSMGDSNNPRLNTNCKIGKSLKKTSENPITIDKVDKMKIHKMD